MSETLSWEMIHCGWFNIRYALQMANFEIVFPRTFLWFYS